MSETMVDRMARAMCASDLGNWDAKDFSETGAGEEPEEQREGYRERALAALKAIREPTEAMLLNAGGEDPSVGSLATAMWHAMIDSAIAEAGL